MTRPRASSLVTSSHHHPDPRNGDKVGFRMSPKEGLLTPTDITMLAKITAENQLTLPKAVTQAVTQAVGPTEYVEVPVSEGCIVLTPVRIQRGDAVSAKLAGLNLTDADVDAAVAWARRQ
jgi:hypothetical protein